MFLIFLFREGAPENGSDTERGEDTRREPRSIHALGRRAPREFIGCVDVAAGIGERFRGAHIYSDLTSGDGSADVLSQVISQQNEPIRLAKRQRTEEYTPYEREDGGSPTDPKRQGHDDRDGEPRSFPQLPKCEAEI